MAPRSLSKPARAARRTHTASKRLIAADKAMAVDELKSVRSRVGMAMCVILATNRELHRSGIGGEGSIYAPMLQAYRAMTDQVAIELDRLDGAIKLLGEKAQVRP